MVIINKINCNRMNFQGIGPLPKSNKINSEILKDYVIKAIEYLRKDGERMIPENGKFSPIAAYLEVKGKPQTARFAVEYDPLDPKTKRLINVGVYRNDSDKIYQRYPFSGTKKEILKYINSDKAPDAIYKHIVELSDKVDN